MSFYQRIQELAQKKGVSFKQIEKEMNYPTNTLYGYKSKVPGGQRLVELSQYFGVSIDYLMSKKAKDTAEEFEELFKTIYKER
ncbi:helix-turn-helix domain-containing protein [Lactococcus lactis]|uniref:helix-turn-helix domain-containing protein n=1 Tax=Lactococcus lactis TaxID=1358 RepID=UPI00223AED86|nr:helix-turn-helix transcriptional regulator [Lactococcus lactis]MCT1181503.1 XRE family transcriptional regulator [Lactococcus lactis]